VQGITNTPNPVKPKAVMPALLRLYQRYPVATRRLHAPSLAGTRDLHDVANPLRENPAHKHRYEHRRDSRHRKY
jgi:hypothetical protein